MIAGICELVLWVKDIERSARFYGGVCGLEIIKAGPSLYFVNGPTFRIHLQAKGAQQAHEGAAGFHFCFTADQDCIGKALVRANEEGLKIVGPKTAKEGFTALWIMDPDDNEVEFSDYYLLPQVPKLEYIDPTFNRAAISGEDAHTSG